MTKVRFVASDHQGCGRIRSAWPALVLDTDERFLARAETWYPAYDEYDVLIVHRALDPNIPEAIKRYKDAGARVIVDEDDDLAHVAQTKNFIGAEIVKRTQWAHDTAMQLADLVTCSTPKLAEAYRELNRTAVCRNHLPRWVSELERPPRGPVPLVGYAGIVKTHTADLEWLAPWAETMMRDARFTWVGDAAVARTLRTITWAG